MKKLIASGLIIGTVILVGGCGKLAADQSKQSNSLNSDQKKNDTLQREKSNKTQEYKYYKNVRYGFKSVYPVDFKTDSVSDNGDGAIYKSTDGEVVLRFFGSNNAMNDTASTYLQFLKSSIDVDPTYEFSKDDRVVLSWVDDETMYYEYIQIGAGSLNGFQVEYPTGSATEIKPLVEKLTAEFVPGDLDKAY